MNLSVCWFTSYWVEWSSLSIVTSFKKGSITIVTSFKKGSITYPIQKMRPSIHFCSKLLQDLRLDLQLVNPLQSILPRMSEHGPGFFVTAACEYLGPKWAPNELESIDTWMDHPQAFSSCFTKRCCMSFVQVPTQRILFGGDLWTNKANTSKWSQLGNDHPHGRWYHTKTNHETHWFWIGCCYRSYVGIHPPQTLGSKKLLLPRVSRPHGRLKLTMCYHVFSIWLWCFHGSMAF